MNGFVKKNVKSHEIGQMAYFSPRKVSLCLIPYIKMFSIYKFQIYNNIKLYSKDVYMHF